MTEGDWRDAIVAPEVDVVPLRTGASTGGLMNTQILQDQRPRSAVRTALARSLASPGPKE